MYKRDTFEHLARHSELVPGIIHQKMKKHEDEVRKKMVVVRMNSKELGLLKQWQSKTTERSTSQYLRKLALNRPVTVICRNASADDFIAEMLLVKKELNAIGNNFNQAVHKLHMLDRIPEFRNWIAWYGNAHELFLEKMDEIMVKADRIARLWLQG